MTRQYKLFKDAELKHWAVKGKCELGVEGSTENQQMG